MACSCSCHAPRALAAPAAVSEAAPQSRAGPCAERCQWRIPLADSQQEEIAAAILLNLFTELSNYHLVLDVQRAAGTQQYSR